MKTPSPSLRRLILSALAVLVMLSCSAWAHEGTLPSDSVDPDQTIDDSSFEELLEYSFPHGYDKTTACKAYRSPGNDSGEPNAPFARDLKKADLRRNAAESFRKMMEPYLLESQTLPSELANLPEEAARVGAKVGAVHFLIYDQKQKCKADVQKMFDGMLEKAPSDEARADIAKVMQKQVDRCSAKTLLQANPFQSSVFIGSNAIGKVDPGIFKLIALHEICHVAYPAIYGQAAEEIFCDAMAFSWLKKLEPIGDLKKTVLEYGRKVRLNDATDELLHLRADMPRECF